jgi:hypothetical protein
VAARSWRRRASRGYDVTVIAEIYRLAVTSEGVDFARLIADWHEREAVVPRGDSDEFAGGEIPTPIVYEPL